MTDLTIMPENYENIRTGIVQLLKVARSAAARNINSIITATYWEIGRRIVELEQDGAARARYGDELIKQLANDLSSQFGRGFGVVNLSQMKKFFLVWPEKRILQTLSEKSSSPLLVNEIQEDTVSSPAIAGQFPLPWSAYVRLLSVKNPDARRFYESEALRAGWSVRQLDRQIGSQFYERIALSKNKAAMLEKAQGPESSDAITPEEAIKDPLVLEFLDLKDEYSESDLEDALIRHLADFLLELGDDFAFVGRQRRLRLDDNWFRVDLVFFHRCLRCLLLADLKIGKFSHADVGYGKPDVMKRAA